MHSIKRPKKGETEEDLLREQEDFLKSNKIDHDKKMKIEENKNTDKDNKTLADAHDIPDIVCNIVEKQVSFCDFKLNNKKKLGEGFPTASKRNPNVHGRKGKSLFAQQFGRKEKVEIDDGKDKDDKTSIDRSSLVTGTGLGVENWEEEMEKIRQENESMIKGLSEKEIIETRNELFKSLDPKIIDFLKKKNKNKTEEHINKNETESKMEVEEIEEEKQEKQEEIKSQEKSIDDIDETIENKLPFKKDELKKWVNMDVVEKDKIEWIGDIPEKDEPQKETNMPTTDMAQTNMAPTDMAPTDMAPTDMAQTDMPPTDMPARFDFEGNLVPANSGDIPTDKLGLHHHGEEPSKAGYTINELLTYLQSSFPGQKVIALKTLGKIFENAYNGYYDGCFNENVIENLLNNTSIILIVRVGLDHELETVWKTTINCLHNIICNTLIDDLCLDEGFPLFINNNCLDDLCLDQGFALFINNNCSNPLDLIPLKMQSLNSSYVEELSDDKFAVIDVIMCLIQRTDLLQRFRYLIDNYHSQMDTKIVNDIFDILVRISRHSCHARQIIVNCPYLIETIITNFLPSSIQWSNLDSNKVNSRALKLIRTLMTDIDLAEIIVTRHVSIVHVLKVYLTIDPQSCDKSKELLKLSIESLMTWSTLLSHGCVVQEFLQLFPILMRQSQFCLVIKALSHTVTYDWQYVSTMMVALKSVCQRVSGFNDIIAISLFQWLTQINNTAHLPDYYVSLGIYSAIELLLFANINIDVIQDKVVSLLLNNLTKLLVNLIEHSPIIALTKHNPGRMRDSSNLPSYGVVYYKDSKVNQFLDKNSSICLFYALVKCLKLTSLKYKEELFKNNEIKTYFNTIRHSLTKISLTKISLTKISLTKNCDLNIYFSIFEQIEFNIISEIVMVASQLHSVEHVYYLLDVSLLCINLIQNKLSKVKLIENVLFNQRFHDAHYNNLKLSEMMKNISLNENELIHKTLQRLDSIKNVYKKYSNFESSFWIFDPILCAYKNKNSDVKDSNMKDSDVKNSNMKDSDVTMHEIVDCLGFINIIIERHRHYIETMTSKSLLFALITTTFLISNELFLDSSVQQILSCFLNNEIFKNISLSETDKLPHIATIGDLFIELLNQYESVSYGNELFSKYLLVFCQRHSSGFFRKQLFESEVALKVLVKNSNIKIDL